MDDERQADQTDDPRRQDVGVGLPETNPAGAAGNGEEGGPRSKKDGGTHPTTSDRESDREKTTGNPTAG
jgi:hypothetical protein